MKKRYVLLLPIRRLASMILALILVLSAILFVSAGAERSEIDSSDMAFAHWGMALTARMIANAADHRAEIGESLYREWSSVQLLRPEKIFIIEMSDSKFLTARNALGDSGISLGVAAALAESINRQFVASYADAATLVRARRDGSTVIRGASAAVLVYGPHIVLVTWNSNKLESAFIISSHTVSSALDADALRENTSRLGIETPVIRTYEGEALNNLLSLNPELHGESPSLRMWSLGEVSSEEIADTAAESAEHMRALLPLIANDDRIQADTVLEALYRFVNSHDSMEMADLMSREFLPMVSGDVQREYLDLHEPIPDKDLNAHPAPEVNWVEDNGIRPDSTFLFVIEKQYPEKDPIIGYDIHLQAALPAEAIPASPEEADYIIRTVATWDGDKYTQGSYEVLYCYMHTAVYDAKTGMKVKDFGTTVHRLNGFMSVSSKITYMSVSRLLIWEQVKSLFK